MALSILGSLWVCSLFVTGALGWLLGRRSRAFSRVLVALKGLSHPMEHKPEAPKPVRKPVKQARAKRPHIFDDMPPVEWVREQAKAILKEESVWELPELCEELYLGHAPSVAGRSDGPGEPAPTSLAYQSASSSTLV